MMGTYYHIVYSHFSAQCTATSLHAKYFFTVLTQIKGNICCCWNYQQLFTLSHPYSSYMHNIKNLSLSIGKNFIEKYANLLSIRKLFLSSSQCQRLLLIFTDKKISLAALRSQQKQRGRKIWMRLLIWFVWQEKGSRLNFLFLLLNFFW